MKRKRGYYSISVVAKMFSVHQQTIRMYEKEGLFAPKRTSGNTRLFSEEDVDRLEEIIYLTHKMGVNLAGVEMILKLKKRIAKLQEEMNSLIKNAQAELENDVDIYKHDVGQQAKRLLEIKLGNVKKIAQTSKPIAISAKTTTEFNEKNSPKETSTKKDSGTNKGKFGDWDIEYDEDI